MSLRGRPKKDESREHQLEEGYRTIFEFAGVGTAQSWERAWFFLTPL
jgi:hypothetical protein